MWNGSLPQKGTSNFPFSSVNGRPKFTLRSVKEMRKQVQKERCTKIMLTKCKAVCHLYDKVQLAAAKMLDAEPAIFQLLWAVFNPERSCRHAEWLLADARQCPCGIRRRRQFFFCHWRIRTWQVHRIATRIIIVPAGYRTHFVSRAKFLLPSDSVSSRANPARCVH